MDNNYLLLQQIKFTISTVETKTRLDAANKSAATSILLAIKERLDATMVESTEYVKLRR